LIRRERFERRLQERAGFDRASKVAATIGQADDFIGL